MNKYRPGESFRRVRDIMLAPDPLSDDDIESLWRQEPLNQSPQLPAEEEQPLAEDKL